MHSFTKLGYLSEFSSIFVAMRKCVEQVFYGLDIELGEFFSETRPDPLEMNNGSGQLLMGLICGRLGHRPTPNAKAQRKAKNDAKGKPWFLRKASLRLSLKP